MKIRDAAGVRYLRLEPVSYQYAQARGGYYDDNWLSIEGDVRSDHEQWGFIDPSLLAAEAQDLGRWLKLAAAGTAMPMVPDDDGLLWPTTEHIEPNIGFGLVRFEPDLVHLRVFLWLESGPPSTQLGDARLEWSMDLAVSPAALEAAASQWASELAKFPPRV